MLAITYEPPPSGHQTPRMDLNGDAFQTTALSFGLDVEAVENAAIMRVTGDPHVLASFYADLRASGIEFVTVTRGRGDGGAEDIFRDALDALGIEVEIVRTL